VFDFGAMLSGLPVSLSSPIGCWPPRCWRDSFPLTALLVDYTTAPVGSGAWLIGCGLASASMTFMVIGFTLAWYLHGDAIGAGNVFVLELVAYLGGLLGSMVARSPQAPGMFEARNSDGWPFTVTR
jgi:hypothetical protein